MSEQNDQNDQNDNTQEILELKEFNKRVIDGAKERRPGNAAEATDIKISTPNARLWAVSGEAYLPCEEAVKELPPGHYVVLQSQTKGVYLAKQDFSIDELLELPDSESERCIAEIQKFWKLEDHFRKFGFLWKRGMMLWGPPGSGKTSTLQILSKKIIQAGGIALSIYNPQLAIVGMHILRKIEPKRPIIGLLEDIDAIINQHGESDLLALLDGENQIDNIVYLATTNYPERLDPRFVNRPSRFDVIKKIGMPSIEARTLYLAAKSILLRKDKKKLEKWVAETEGLSVAHLKELIISVEVFGVNYERSLERLKTMMECNATSKDGYDGESGKQFGYRKKVDIPEGLAKIIDKVLRNMPTLDDVVSSLKQHSGADFDGAPAGAPEGAHDEFITDDSATDPDDYEGCDYEQ